MQQPAPEASPLVGAPPRPSTHDLVRAIRDDGSVDAAFRGGLEAGLKLFGHMLRLRLLSATMVDLQRAERVSFHASSVGEEAAIVASVLGMRDGDWVFPGTREWGAAIVRGLPVTTYVQHAFGAAGDPAVGHSAPDHPPARSLRVGPASGVVGAHLPQAVGCAWAARMKKDDVAVLALFGEGATSTGDFHNALNFAGVFKAPCVLVCRNNGRATSTPVTRQSRTETFADKAVAYGLGRVRVDGTDALAVLAVVRAAVVRASEGRGATLVEVVTQPLALSEERNGTDVAALGDLDPIVRLRRVLEREGVLAPGAEQAMAQAAREEIARAVATAENAGAPPSSSMFEHVFAEVPAYLDAQRREASSCRR